MGDADIELEEACKNRELGKLEEARRLFENLLAKTDKDKALYPKLMGEYIIQLRLEIREKLEEALQIAREFEKNSPQRLEGKRAVAHVQMELGQFEQAIERLEYMAMQFNENSLKKGEAQSHLAYAYLRTARVDEAEELIKQARLNIQRNTAKEAYTEVRESYALRIEALVAEQQGDKKGAREKVRQALDVAKQGNAVFRIKEAEELLNMF